MKLCLALLSASALRGAPVQMDAHALLPSPHSASDLNHGFMMPVRNESAGIATLHAPSALINDTAWLAGNVSLLASVSAPTANVATMALAIICHIPLGLILFFLLLGALERFGFLCLGRKFVAEGALPEVRPLVCVQLAMYNEYAVAERIITAACAMRWPREQLEVQVLDDSTDPVLRAMIDEVVERERESGTNVHVMRREERSGYKAGALEAGRKQTDARFLVLFDADFIPSADFIERTVSRFYDETGDERTTLALVQAQWGHLNPASSMLTAHQSLWIDDHHTLQMSFRSAAWGFINFTGTAGTWRAEAIERAGGWSAKSLVEDCELSFRVLFSGYTTSFVRDVVQQSENPDTWTAYKAQQKRWTQAPLPHAHRIAMATVVSMAGHVSVAHRVQPDAGVRLGGTAPLHLPDAPLVGPRFGPRLDLRGRARRPRRLRRRA